MIDIHSHILPGLDDGAATLDDSLAMLRMAAESGTTDIVATPHANLEFTFDPALIEEKIAEVQAAHGPVPRIHRGCDFHLTMENIQDALANPGKYTINHKNYLMVEFSDFTIPKTTQEIFHRFQSAGIIPVITHPERNALLHKRLDEMQSWVENGALIQVTAHSLLGLFGRTARAIAGELFERNMVHFVASDAHDAVRRTTSLGEAFDHVKRQWGAGLAETVFVTAPRAAIEGDPILLMDSEPVAPKRKWYRFGF
ncbi:MAG: CpsB/CapC family capsule biosynthesis tyrosine phosphatase [Bryobacteraceae bacterium]